MDDGGRRNIVYKLFLGKIPSIVYVSQKNTKNVRYIYFAKLRYQQENTDSIVTDSIVQTILSVVS